MEASLLIRRARQDDAATLTRISLLDSVRPIDDDNALVAELAGEIVAAYDLVNRRAVADPFRPTSSYVDLLRLRAEQLTTADAPGATQAAHAAGAGAYA